MDLYSYFLSIRGQAGCLGIVLYLGSIYFLVKRKDTIQHRLFSLMILASIVNIVFDMITVYTVNHLDAVSPALNHAFHIVFVGSIVVILYIIFLYVQTLAYQRLSFKKPWLIPLLIAVPAVLFLPIHYNESPYGNYSGGLYVIVAYICAYTYFVLSVIVLIRRRKFMEAKSIRAITVAMSSMFIVTTVEGIWGEMLVSSLGITLVNVAFFYTVESPDAILIERLREETEKAKSANRAKSSFLAQMSHEIRTPINAILGMNEMILHESKENPVLDYAGNIDAAGKTLLSIINGILDFSKIEDGKMEILPVRYDTASVVNNLVNSIEERARAKSLRFQVEIDESLPSGMVGDSVRIEQIIMNLLTNAVKYTREGKVVLTIRAAAREPGAVTLEVSVKDTGIGIRKEDMDRLFTPFERLDQERNRAIEGTGLGLSIVTRLLAMMGSSLQVESEYGVGSTFSFLLRQEIADEKPIGDYEKRYREIARQGGVAIHLYAPEARVLVVDDNEMNLKVARNLMHLFGIVPEMAGSGKTAIEMMRDHRYDIVFLDHMMPEMDGIETLDRLRAERLIPEGTAMIVLTANAVSGARESYLAAGFDDYLSKPIALEKLEEKLRQYLPFGQTAEEADAASSAAERGGGRISAEGDPEILEFSPAGEESDPAVPDPAVEQEALRGEILEFAPSAPEGGSAPVLERIREAGLAVDKALGYCGDDESFYVEILHDYAESCAENREKLEDAFLRESWLEYRTEIHALKSISRTIGAPELSDRARRLEEAAAGADADVLRRDHPGCMAEYAALADRIRKALGES